MSADDELVRKLRRLRREAPPQGDGPGEAERSPKKNERMPIWMQRRLERARRNRVATAEEVAPAVAVTVGEPEALRDGTSALGTYGFREVLYSQGEQHGRWRLDEVDRVDRSILVTLARDELLAELDLRRAVYLDIETTGLSGGAGTSPFMVALGYFSGREFRLWQGFLRDPEEEPAMLQAVADIVAASSGVVSFFGKSFDRHRLEDKMRLHGVDPPFEGRPHLDLYHPLSRLYREALPDGKLQTMERELCGVGRSEDLPGRFAPEAWYDYLADRPHRLEAVFRHNRDDVLSLVVLAAHLGHTLEEKRPDGAELEGPGWARARALGRLFAERRERELALEWIERSLDRRSEGSRSLRVLRADQLRLLVRVDEAWRAYEELVEEAEDMAAGHCCLQLAKLAEHRLRDRDKALAALRRARRILRRAPLEAGYRALEQDLERRSLRLGLEQAED